jgi:hypothetical protein
MTKRGLVLVGAGALLVVGCARAGAVNGGSPPYPYPDTTATATTSAPVYVMPTAGLAACVDTSATPPATDPGTSPSPTAVTATDQFDLNNAANNMFRQRHAMPALYVAAAEPCVRRVRAGLETLRKQNRYDNDSVARVLRDAGLTDITTRAPGRLDLGPGDGVVFAAETGVGCLFGQHAPETSTADFGSAVADGGCLVAPN